MSCSNRLTMASGGAGTGSIWPAMQTVKAILAMRCDRTPGSIVNGLAGDLLEGATLDQRIATGFHRNTLRNTEAGVDLELYRTKEIVDRVSTTGMVWLGLTLGCAECHDHKNDPISQTEFYRFYAFFNNADEVGVPVTRSWEVEEYEAALQNWQPKWTALVADLKPFEVDELTAGQQATIAEAFVADSRSFDWKKLLDLYQTNAPGWKELQARVDVLATGHEGSRLREAIEGPSRHLRAHSRSLHSARGSGSTWHALGSAGSGCSQ